MVPETQHTDTFGLQRLRSVSIVASLARLGMSTAIKLDGEQGLVAVKV